MELVIDKNFKEMYEAYYGELRSKVVLDVINGMFSKFDPEIVNDTINIIKTSIACGFTFTDCYDKIVETILSKFPVDRDIDKFILSMVVKILIATGSEDIYDLIRSPRDIYKEVTAKHFRVPIKKVTQEMIHTVVAAAKKFEETSYSVDEPPTATWDEYFYNMARQAARNSKCLSRRIGCVMVKDKSILSTGYNGPPRGIPRCDLRWKIDPGFVERFGKKVEGKETEGICPRYAIGFKSGEGLEICPAGHAERNALINAARHGVATLGTTLYMSCGMPCSPCLVEIINAGVKEIVVTSLKIYDDTTLYLLTQGDLRIRLFDFIK
jgi:dCMP deaminase